MFKSTLTHLSCLQCQKDLKLGDGFESDVRGDVLWGEVSCTQCTATYPILAGVLLYVADLEDSLIRHIKGIQKLVPDERIPAEQAEVFFEARESLAEEGFFDEGLEEDLEAARVNALYVMNHFLPARSVPRTGDPVLDRLVSEHWDHGPLEHTRAWIATHAPGAQVVEFGSSVGGLAQRLGGSISGYLGLDASFLSVALARHLVLGAPYPERVLIPGDLLEGPVSIEPELPAPAWQGGGADFVLGDVQNTALKASTFDVSVAIGLIDMLDDPRALVRAQSAAVRHGGSILQAGPCIWHESVARKLREGGARDSAGAVESLYCEAGLKPVAQREAIPWVFFKHLRQVEVYSVYWSGFRK